MDPYEVFASLGPLAVYRHPDALRAQWTTVQAAQDELKRRFEACSTDRERLLLTVEVSAHLIRISGQRACGCQSKFADLACENLDMFGVAADWVAFVQQRTLESPDQGPGPSVRPS